MNPWIAQTIAIASIDYIKRPEVLPAVSDCLWDMVIVDEAHGVCGESDRQAAVNALGARASYLLLLTATPHSGNRHAFLSLCDVGMLENDPLLIFRRTRADVMVGPPRRIHIRRVPPNADERRMYERLNAYAAAIRRERGELRDAAWLALAVLHKRAFSSAWSLAQSVERRLAALAPTVRSNGDQIPLPFDDGEADAATEDEPPAWPEELALASPAHEHAILMGLAASARAASECQTKTATLDRLLRRTHESAIVFTEYRDTLLHIAERVPVPHVLIHGGLTVREREMAVDIFSRAPRMILLATDAAGEGLNLQRRCRLVINLELPWNPMRLEQRIGRVDRIGQNRRVHAVHLVAQGTGEEEILRRLKTRVAAAQADIGSANPVGTLDDVEAMRSIAGENR
jgi:SNF2 family DNA or RNA helicase